jgi:hypothetical protein
MAPVGEQWIVLVPKESSYVRGMIDGRIKIGKTAAGKGKIHKGGFLRKKQLFVK